MVSGKPGVRLLWTLLLIWNHWQLHRMDDNHRHIGTKICLDTILTTYGHRHLCSSLAHRLGYSTCVYKIDSCFQRYCPGNRNRHHRHGVRQQGLYFCWQLQPIPCIHICLNDRNSYKLKNTLINHYKKAQPIFSISLWTRSCIVRTSTASENDKWLALQFLILIDNLKQYHECLLSAELSVR